MYSRQWGTFSFLSKTIIVAPPLKTAAIVNLAKRLQFNRKAGAAGYKIQEKGINLYAILYRSYKKYLVDFTILLYN